MYLKKAIITHAMYVFVHTQKASIVMNAADLKNANLSFLMI